MSYESNCSGYKAVYFGESKQSLKVLLVECKIPVRTCNCRKNLAGKYYWKEYHNFVWDQKKVFDRESRLLSRKIKETIHFLEYPNHINKFSFMLPEIWILNLQ